MSLLLSVQVKNRESAARSRARKQEYTAQLEVQVAKLREENRLLLEKVSLCLSLSHRDLFNSQAVSAMPSFPRV